MLTYNIDLDVTPGVIPAVVHVKQFQTDAVIKFNLFSRTGQLSIGSSPTCTVRGTKSDGNGYSATATYTAETKTVSVQLAEQMTAVAGRQPYELTVTDSTGKMVTATFYLDVQKAALSRSTISNSQILEIIDATDNVDAMMQVLDLRYVIANLKEILTPVPERMITADASLFELNAIGDSGQNITNAKNTRSQMLSYMPFVTIPNDGTMRVYYYNTTELSSFVRRSGPISTSDGVMVSIKDIGCPFMRILTTKSDLSDYSSGDVAAINNGVVFYTWTSVKGAIEKADESLRYIYGTPLSFGSITVGSQVGGSGNFINSTTQCRTSLMAAAGKRRIVIPDGYVLNMHLYDSTSTSMASHYIKTIRVRQTGDFLYDFSEPVNGKTVQAFVVTFRPLDGHAVTSSDAEAIASGFGIYKPSFREESLLKASEKKAKFVEYMAYMCTKLGMANSVFENASGLTRESHTTPLDELKLAIAVAGNPKALDIWSTQDRSFDIGGSNARSINIVNNVFGGEDSNNYYKLLGGKGGTLSPDGSDGYRKARVGIYEVDEKPVCVAIAGPGAWINANITACVQDICAMIDAKMRDETVVWTNDSDVNFRSSPSTDATVLRTLTDGTVAIVMNPEPDQTYYRCRIGSQIGYISTSYVSTSVRGNLKTLIDNGGGYCAVDVPIDPGTYLNSRTPSNLLQRKASVHANETASQIPASTTKTLTMLCVLNIVSDLQEVISLQSSAMAGGSGSTFYAYDKITVEEALRIMMMESSNTWAEMLGMYAGEKLMNIEIIKS